MRRRQRALYGKTRQFLVLLAFMPSPSLAYDPLDCLKDAGKIAPNITVGLATRLCSAAWSPEPLKCFATIPEVDDGITLGISVELCAGTTDGDRTVQCYRKAWHGGISRGQATTLCSARPIDRR
jgi:hypothetical protein